MLPKKVQSQWPKNVFLGGRNQDFFFFKVKINEKVGSSQVADHQLKNI